MKSQGSGSQCRVGSKGEGGGIAESRARHPRRMSIPHGSKERVGVGRPL